ncbi:hypothetical protein FIBSPDRAFT_970829 [Athelia psychrophila]|uniref:Uncharacterized protein n=1 Tax=Athelia psychrophila TaxID=1759441 RepID=A0A167SHM6_9AGAM|nr:hypothetical protein FIBSPDRAFT_970829 [Fibularhizoctonia sp. CBS 109695]
MQYQEFAQLTPNNTVYKLIGPVLIRSSSSSAEKFTSSLRPPLTTGCANIELPAIRKRVEGQQPTA